MMLTSLTKRRSADGHWPRNNYAPLFSQRIVIFGHETTIREFDDIETLVMNHIINHNIDASVDVDLLQITREDSSIVWYYHHDSDELDEIFKESGECSSDVDSEAYKEEFDAWVTNCPEEITRAMGVGLLVDYCDHASKIKNEEQSFYLIDYLAEILQSWTYEQWLRSDVIKGDILYPAEKNRAKLNFANDQVNKYCWRLTGLLDSIGWTHPPVHCNSLVKRDDWLESFHLQHVPLAVKSCLMQVHMLIERLYE